MVCRSFAFVSLLWLLSPVPASAQILPGAHDDFEDGSLLGWTNGSAADPLNALGGPGGAADHYLEIRTNGAGGGPGSQLTAFNRFQWADDYATNSITGISIDLRNFNVAAPLAIRLALKTDLGSGAPSYITPSFSLPNDGLWHHHVFALDASMIPVNGPPPLANVLGTSTVEFRIMHSVDSTDVIGDTTPGTAARLGVDNITAMAVPEPGALILTGLAAAWTIANFRRSRRATAVTRGAA